MNRFILVLILCLASGSGFAQTQPGSPVKLVDPTTPAQAAKINSNGSLNAAVSSITTNVVTSALAANLVVKTGAFHLVDFQVSADSTLSAAAWWIQIYDATAAPADGAVTPAKCYAMPAGQTVWSGAFPAPLAVTTGIVIGVSTTGCFTKTASTHAFISGDWQ